MYAFRLAKRYKKEFSSVVLASFVSLVLNMLCAYIVAQVINAASGKSIYSVPVVIVLTIVIFVVNPFGGYFINKASYKFSQKFMTDFRQLIIESYVNSKDDTVSSDFLNTVNSTTTKLKDMYVMPFLKAIRYVILFVGTSIYLLHINKIVFVLTVVCSLLSLVIPQIFNKKNQMLRGESIGENEKFISRAKEIGDGYETIKSFGIEDRIMNLFKKDNNENQDKLFKANRFAVFHMAFSFFISTLGILAALISATYMAGKGLMTAGEIGAIIQLSNYIISPLMEVPASIISMKSIEPELKRIDEMKSKRLLQSDRLADFKFDNEIVVDDLSYSYGDNKVLCNVSFTLEKGKKYAIVGESGSGKSTLANILLNKLDYSQGSIKFDGTELNTINIDDFYKNISLVSQNVFLFNDTIKNNISLYSNYGTDIIQNSIEKSKLDSVISKLPDKEDTVLGEYGTSLSGGEMQRVSIARALVKDSSFIVMDEATSSLDIKTARAIENTLLSLDQTVLVITHRIDESILKKYDEIFLLQGGTIAEKGNYSDINYFNEVIA